MRLVNDAKSPAPRDLSAQFVGSTAAHGQWRTRSYRMNWMLLRYFPYGSICQQYESHYAHSEGRETWIHVSMILAFAMKNPQATASTIEHYKTPGQVNVAKLEGSAADFAMQTLNCYHKSARFRGVNILGTPWREQNKFGAEGCVVLRISFSCVSGTTYQMIVAAMAKGRSDRTFVINENSLIPYNKKCSLEYWTAAEAQ